MRMFVLLIIVSRLYIGACSAHEVERFSDDPLIVSQKYNIMLLIGLMGDLDEVMSESKDYYVVQKIMIDRFDGLLYKYQVLKSEGLFDDFSLDELRALKMTVEMTNSWINDLAKNEHVIITSEYVDSRDDFVRGFTEQMLAKMAKSVEVNVKDDSESDDK